MSVPLSKRSHSKLEAIIKAQDLVKHTLNITTNEKIFTTNYKALIEDLVHTAENIFINCFTANTIVVRNNKVSAERRIDLQTKAIQNCNQLLALMDLAYSIFHLRAKKVEFWGKLTLETRTLIKSWRDSDIKRYYSLLKGDDIKE